MKKLVMILAVVVMVLGMNVTSYASRGDELGTHVGYEECLKYVRSDGDTVVDHGTYADIHSNVWGIDYVLLSDGTFVYEHPEYKDTDKEYTFHRAWKYSDGQVWMHAYDMNARLISVTRVY